MSTVEQRSYTDNRFWSVKSIRRINAHVIRQTTVPVRKQNQTLYKIIGRLKIGLFVTG